MEPQEEPKKPKYSDAQKRATHKYRTKNKDKINQQRKVYYEARKAKDPTFLEYKRLKAKEYYNRRKELTKQIEERRLKSKDIDEINQIKEELKQPKPIKPHLKLDDLLKISESASIYK